MIQGNLIGTDVTGEGALGNGSNGYLINEGANLVIGGSVAGSGQRGFEQRFRWYQYLLFQPSTL